MVPQGSASLPQYNAQFQLSRRQIDEVAERNASPVALM
jgi:hypothetical protein